MSPVQTLSATILNTLAEFGEKKLRKALKPYDPEREQNSYIGTAGSPLMKNFSAGLSLNF